MENNPVLAESDPQMVQKTNENQVACTSFTNEENKHIKNTEFHIIESSNKVSEEDKEISQNTSDHGANDKSQELEHLADKISEDTINNDENLDGRTEYSEIVSTSVSENIETSKDNSKLNKEEVEEMNESSESQSSNLPSNTIPNNPEKQSEVIILPNSKSMSLKLLATEYASSEESEEDSSYSESDEDEDETSEYTDTDTSSSDLSEIRNTLKHPSSDNLDVIASEIEVITNAEAYRDKITEIDSDTDSSDSSIEIIEYKSKKTSETINLIDNEEDDDDEETTKKSKKSTETVRCQGELLLSELPPIEDLYITVPEEECAELGHIQSIVDQLVIVDCIPGTCPLDLDTVLFLEKGNKVLGKVFDVLGQVKSPMYCVRFNSRKQIEEKDIKIGQTVYVAPRTEHTQFIILDNLMKIRGSDASWENDVEPPESHLEFSDDEEERNARKNRRAEKSGQDNNSVNDASNLPQTSSRKRRLRGDFQQHQTYNTTNNMMSNSFGFNQNQISQNLNSNSATSDFNYYPPPYNFNELSSLQRFNQPYYSSRTNATNFQYNQNNSLASNYTSNNNSWHNNFNPRNSYGNGYPNNYPQSQPGYMQQQPLFPPYQYRQPPQN